MGLQPTDSDENPIDWDSVDVGGERERSIPLWMC
jgi:hypothetical protein